MKCYCKRCGRELEVDKLNIDDESPSANCPDCGSFVMTETEHEAILYAEKTGVYEYDVNEDGWFEYWSFFPGEGFRFVQYNLWTGEEHRDGFIPWKKEDDIPVPMFLKEMDPKNPGSWATKYNYNCG